VPAMTTSRTTSVAVALTALVLAAASTPPESRSSAPAPSAAPDTSGPRVTRGSELAVRPSRPARQLTPGPRPAYGWPVKPFHRQHPIRGFFGDPRMANHGQSRQFHFGVDISASNGTPVYATLTGRVYVHPLHPTTIGIVDDGGVEFSYWHVIPSVHTGDRAIAYRTVIGHIEEPYGHVHFSERRDGRYLNPLRPGALGPYADDTRPFVRSVRVEARRGLLVAEVYDQPPLAVPRPWHDLPVMPALVRWRLLNRSGQPVSVWRSAVDFRSTIPHASAFDEIWAPGVTQNHVRSPGRYRLALARSLSGLRAGTYLVELTVGDTRGNSSRARFRIAIPKS
jgi:hypothetical protein